MPRFNPFRLNEIIHPAKTAWEFIKKLEVGGVRYREEKKDGPKDTELVEDLACAISDTHGRQFVKPQFVSRTLSLNLP